jgi:RNA-directed DNA polymerase
MRWITRRNRGWSLGSVVKELNSYLTGWSSYFGHCVYAGQMGELDGWIRRKLRCLRLKQLKGYSTMVKYFVRAGVGKNHAWETVLAGFRWWRLSHTVATNKAMGNTGFKSLG